MFYQAVEMSSVVDCIMDYSDECLFTNNKGLGLNLFDQVHSV